MTAYLDIADGHEKLMLCFVEASGFVRYLIHDQGVWTADAGHVGQLTDGPMALAQLGPSLYLVYKERNTRHMRMTSFNLAPFNAFEAVAFDDTPAPANDTSLHRWSPFDMHVGHFSKKMGALQNSYQALGRFAMAAIEGEMHLVNRGGYDDTPEAYTEVFGLQTASTSPWWPPWWATWRWRKPQSSSTIGASPPMRTPPTFRSPRWGPSTAGRGLPGCCRACRGRPDA